MFAALPVASLNDDHEHVVLRVTAVSDPTEVLVYAVGRANADGTGDFTDRTPPTNPGFVVPELATILIAISSFSALGVYALKRKR